MSSAVGSGPYGTSVRARCVTALGRGRGCGQCPTEEDERKQHSEDCTGRLLSAAAVGCPGDGRITREVSE